MKRHVGFFLLLLMFLIACANFGRKSDEITDISEIKKEYHKSQDDARKKYDGKELTVLGTVTYRSSINPTIKIGSTTDSDIPMTVPDLECHFEESDVLFKNVTDKQIIKVKGIVKFTASGIEMRPCKFVAF